MASSRLRSLSSRRAVALVLGVLAVLAAGVIVLELRPDGTHQTAVLPARPVIQRISDDLLPPFTTHGATMEHRTEVEGDTFAHGSTVVAAFEVGRNGSGYGAQAIGFATSTDAGTTWSHGLLPGLTVSSPHPNRQFPTVVNQTVAFDARHGRWIVSSVGYVPDPSSPGAFHEKALLVNTSADGLHWSVARTAVASDVDKPWSGCDDTPASPHYGTCYVAYTQLDSDYHLVVIRSTDGGTTWSGPVRVPGARRGSAAQGYDTNLVVQPDGRVVVVVNDLRLGFTGSALSAFTSTDGGTSWSVPRRFATARFHLPTPIGVDGLRAKNKPVVAVDGAGRVWVAWSDCRFEAGCATDDIVVASTTTGATWSAPRRVDVGPVAPGTDEFLPGLAVEPGTKGVTAHLGVSYYTLRRGSCPDCRVQAAYTTSYDGGASWSAPYVDNPAGFPVTWAARSSDGRMVGDFTSVSFARGRAVTVAALPTSAPRNGTAYQQSMYAVTVPAGWGASRRP